jgi:hypothetical protein
MAQYTLYCSCSATPVRSNEVPDWSCVLLCPLECPERITIAALMLLSKALGAYTYLVTDVVRRISREGKGSSTAFDACVILLRGLRSPCYSPVCILASRAVACSAGG